jgi:hypothetical protein
MTEPTKQPRPGVPVPPDEWMMQRCDSWGEFSRAHIKEATAWGADEQLRLCIEWMESARGLRDTAKLMRRELRPEPVNLKQQALEALALFEPPHRPASLATARRLDLIRDALEALPD